MTEEKKRIEAGPHRKDGLARAVYIALRDILKSAKRIRAGISAGTISTCTLGMGEGSTKSINFFARDAQDSTYLSVRVGYDDILFDPLDIDHDKIDEMLPVRVEVTQVERGEDGRFYYPAKKSEEDYQTTLDRVLLFSISEAPKDDWRYDEDAIDLYYTDNMMHTVVPVAIDYVDVGERGYYCEFDKLLREADDLPDCSDDKPNYVPEKGHED